MDFPHLLRYLCAQYIPAVYKERGPYGRTFYKASLQEDGHCGKGPSRITCRNVVLKEGYHLQSSEANFLRLFLSIENDYGSKKLKKLINR